MRQVLVPAHGAEKEKEMRDLIQRGSERRRHREAVETRSRETLGLDPIAGEVVPFRRTVVPGLKRMVG